MSRPEHRDLAQELEALNFQLNHRLVQMEALHQAMLVLSASLDSQELRGDFLRLAVGTVDARCGFLFLREDDKGPYELADEANFAPQDLIQLAHVDLYACVDEVVLQQESVLLSGAADLPATFPGEHLLLAPVGDRGCIGVVDKETRDGLHSFDEMDGHLLEMMGKQAGLSLANARLFRQMSEEHNINVNIVNSIANGVVSTDLRGIVLRVNPVAERIFGHGADELIGQALTKLLADCGCPLLGAAVLETLADGKPRQISEEKMGSTDVLLRARVTPLLTAGERVDGAVIALEDMTQRARLESMFKQYASDQVVDMLLPGDKLPSLGGAGGHLAFCCTSRTIARTLQIMGLLQTATLHDTEAEATTKAAG